MERTLIIETIEKIGQEILLRGFIASVRSHGKLAFIDLTDRTGLVQVVVPNYDQKLSVQDVVEILGQVKARPEKMTNPNIKTGTVEVEAKTVTLLETANELPFDMGGEELNVSLETLLDYRPLTLRHKKIRAIFKLQESIARSFRKSLRHSGFTEIFVPTIVPTATEGGAEVFKVEYYDKTAYLGQSPQLYKQMMVGVFERVFTIAHAYRAEPSITTRHLSEYMSLDAELGFINDFGEIMDIVESTFRKVFDNVNKFCGEELALYGATTPVLCNKIPRIKMREAQEIIKKRTGRDNTKEPDLSPEDEREICKYSLEEFKSDLIFITHYPTKKRPFYTYPDKDDPEYTNSFDLLGRGLEWVTGGRRINNYEKLLENIKKWGNKPEDFELYLQAFKYGMPPEGGFAAGLERVTMQILGLGNIREASLFPRDMQRVDIKIK